MHIFGLICSHRFEVLPDGTTSCLAAGVLGGRDTQSVPRFIPEVASFDGNRFFGFEHVLQVLSDSRTSEGTNQDEFVGCVMALAIACSNFEVALKPSHVDSIKHPAKRAKVEERWDQLLARCQHFETSCDGLSASNEVKNMGKFLLYSYLHFSEVATVVSANVSSVDEAFGSRVDFASQPSYEFACKLLQVVPQANSNNPSLAGQLFALHLAVWEILNLAKRLRHPSNDVVVHMLKSSPNPEDRICGCFVEAALHHFQSSKRASLSGEAVCRISAVPPSRRGEVLSRVAVLCTLRNFDGDLNATPTAMLDYLQLECHGLIDAMKTSMSVGGPSLKFKMGHTLKVVQHFHEGKDAMK
jgi:hypothetical protein